MSKDSNYDPYAVVKSVYITEKSTVLQGLASAESNRCVAACKRPKAVFLVDPKANKREIAKAVEAICATSGKATVVKVNTINTKGKKRRVRGRLGRTSAFRKAIVTFEAGDSIEGLF